MQTKSILRLRPLILAGAALLLLAAAPARVQASLTLTLSEVGTTVVVSGSGTINLTGLTVAGNTTFSGNIYPAGAGLFAGPAATTPVTGYTGAGLIGPASFGPSNTESFPNTGSGNIVGIYGTGLELYVPQGYVSGAFLSGSSTFNNATFASLGFTPGTYIYTWGTGSNADSLTVTGVPEPSTCALLGLGGVGLASVLRRHRLRRA